MSVPNTEIHEVIRILEQYKEIREIEFDDPKSRLHIKIVKQDREMANPPLDLTDPEDGS